LSFLEIEKDAFYSVESTTFGKKFVTARSWVDLSRTMTLFEEAGKTVDKTLIGQFLQDDDIAERFASYYMLFDKYRDDYRIEAILAGDIADDVRERAQAAPFDERLALIGLILDKLGAAMSNVAEQEGALERVRDILREDKPTLLAGGTVPETLGTRIAAVESELANREGAPLSAATRRILAEELEMLRELRGECELTKNMEGEAAFNTIHYAYRGLVSNLEHSIKNAGAALDNAFDFVENVLADDREMLVFLTELTARKTCISYINHFGNERYFANNSRLMVSEKATDLKAKIAKLSDVQNASATEAAPAATQATPQPTTPSPSPSAACSPSPKELEAYYQNTDFEYGFASLCNMTLPGDIRGLSVLDIGCRRGKGVFKMSDRVGEAGRAVGIDWSADYITEATTRMDRAWRKSGLTRNNMEFYQGYPEDLVALGFGDATFDLVFVNSVLNLCADPQAVIREAYRVLKPGGRLVCEGAVASGTRDASVVEAARKLGNSIQAGPARDEFIAAVKAVGFQEPAIIDNKPVEPDTGYKTSHKVACAPSEETVTFEATVFEFKK
jgi:ubiquinone/menaquinone biosynthesis C-methylase UbiE